MRKGMFAGGYIVTLFIGLIIGVIIALCMAKMMFGCANCWCPF